MDLSEVVDFGSAAVHAPPVGKSAFKNQTNSISKLLLVSKKHSHCLPNHALLAF
jgi:hypothetical protein